MNTGTDNVSSVLYYSFTCKCATEFTDLTQVAKALVLLVDGTSHIPHNVHT